MAPPPIFMSRSMTGSHIDRRSLMLAIFAKGHSMRSVTTFLAILAWSNVAAGAPLMPSQRDGEWLRNGIKQYERLNAHENMLDKDTNDAKIVASYVCAIVDLENYLVQRAALLSAALEEGKRKRPSGPKILDGMSQTVPILVPLSNSEFSAKAPSCDTALIIVRDYLDKYPEMLPKDADVIVERALLAAYTKDNEP